MRCLRNCRPRPRGESEKEMSALSAQAVAKLIPGPHCRMAVRLDSEGNSILLHQLNPV